MRTHRTFPPLIGLLPLVVLLVGWQVVADPDASNLPPPSTWWDAVRAVDERGLLVPAVVRTVLVFFAAITIATVAGVAFGTVLGASSRARAAFGPLAEFLRNFPPPASVPVAVLLIGNNLAMNLVVIVSAALWPILLNTEGAVRDIPPVRIAVGRMLQLSRTRRVFSLLVPSVLPMVMVGVRVATPVCLIVTLLAEMLASTGGIGQVILERQRLYDSAGVFGFLIIVAALGLLVTAIVGGLERVILRNWPPRHGDPQRP
ncbi:ABC transporter permease [Cryptosporangium sp. NPDC048952]|uniref:ABC transporter permease n=1 Tax=Cryptosporangium sp. NPDC048952 TaxID=3363961 RepID=UPI003713B0D1